EGGEATSAACSPWCCGLSRAELLECTGDVDPRHLLPPRELEIGVVHRFGGAERRFRGGGDRLGFEVRAAQRRPGFRNFQGKARHTTENDSCVRCLVAIPPDPGGDAEHGEVEGTTPAPLVIDRIPTVGGGEPHRRENLVGLLGEVVDAVVVVETCGGGGPLGRMARERRAC